VATLPLDLPYAMLVMQHGGHFTFWLFYQLGMSDTLLPLLIMLIAFFGESIKHVCDQLQSHELLWMLGECFYLAKLELSVMHILSANF
jgi:hypothetical protein